MSSLKTYVAVFGFLLFAFSAVQVGLSAYALYFYDNHRHGSTNETFTYTTTATNILYNYYWLPNYVLNRSYALQVATGALGIIIGLFVLLIAAMSKSVSFTVTGRNVRVCSRLVLRCDLTDRFTEQAPRKFAWTSVALAAIVLFLLLAIPSLIVTFYDSSHHGSGQTEYMTPCLAQLSTDYVCSGTAVLRVAPWTLEGWICSMWDTYDHLQYRLSAGAPSVLHKTCRVTVRYKPS